MELQDWPVPRRELPISDDPGKGLDFATSIPRPAAVAGVHAHNPRTCGFRSASTARGDS
jgi:hypothetical protein